MTAYDYLHAEPYAEVRAAADSARTVLARPTWHGDRPDLFEVLARYRQARAWRDKAACVDHPLQWWHPVSSMPRADRRGERLYAQAKAICMTCPVRDDCLAEALANREQWGMWGGLTPEERREVKP